MVVSRLISMHNKLMRQCDIIRYLFRDLKEATSNLVLDVYPNIFEEEIQEHYPFEEKILEWLTELYSSEKYNELTGADRTLLFEKSHPFLFIRDLSSLNNWRAGYHNKQRLDHVTGLLFSLTPEIAFESTIALCQPTLVEEPVSQWFDAKQAMNNLDVILSEAKDLSPPEHSEGPSHPEAQPKDLAVEAWRACGYYYLYMHFTDSSQPPREDEVAMILEPFRQAIDFGLWHGDIQLKHQCRILDQALAPKKFQTLNDTMSR